MPDDMLQTLLDAVSVASVAKQPQPLETTQAIDAGGLFPCFHCNHENIDGSKSVSGTVRPGLSWGSPGQVAADKPKPLATLATLATNSLPQGVGVFPAAPRLFRADCSLFIASWQATRAAQLGWTVLDLFGAHCRAPSYRVQCSGLLWLLDSRLIAALSADAATIRCASGSVQTFRRSGPHIGQVPAWELPQ
jgi:hypothetical protein